MQTPLQTVVESMGRANGHDAAAGFFGDKYQRTDKARQWILSPVQTAIDVEEALEDAFDLESTLDLLNQAAQEFNTGWDASAVANYRAAFRQGFEARVTRDAVALLID